MARMTNSEFLRLVLYNFDAINSISIGKPNTLGIGVIKVYYDIKKIEKEDE